MNDKRITRAIALCKKIVSCFSYSWKKRRHLAEVQMQLDLPCQFVTESATRWGSRQLMIERVLEQQGALAKVLSSDKKTRHLVPTWQDIEVPRFRTTYISIEKVEALKNRAVLKVETLLADQSSCQLPYPHVPTVPGPAKGESAGAPKAKKTLASFVKQQATTTTAQTTKEAVENELLSYLQSANVESDTDPLKW